MENKETEIQEAAEYYAHNNFNMHDTNNYKALRDGFIEGANWQKQKMFTKKDMIDFHVEVMKVGLIEEGEKKWTDAYEPKIREVAENYFRQINK